MDTIKILILLIGITFLFENKARGDNESPTDKDLVVLSGHIKDGATGELLIAATVYFKNLKTGTVSNLYGFYSFSVSAGTYEVEFIYLGYKAVAKTIEITGNTTLDIELFADTETIEEVVVTSKKADAHVRDPQMSVQKLQNKDIRAVPALMGEVDVIKVLQLMPGVQATSEGSSGFSVRGGNPDQNLILLDEAIVYNAGHMLGFFSVFNNDAIKDVQLYKGDIPARYGGRLSSLVDVRMNDGNNKYWEGNGGIGVISSRLTLQGPVVKDKTSVILSARRTYADMFLPLFGNEDNRDNKIFFYDINAKIKHVINNNNRVYLSFYTGRDVFKETRSSIDYGNQTFTLRWNHVYNPKLFSNITLVNSNYDYHLEANDETSGFRWDSKLTDYSLKIDFNYYLNPNNTLSFGGQSIYHGMEPATAMGTGDNALMNRIEVPDANALEHALYIGNSQSIGRWGLRYGLRFSGLQNIGRGTVYAFDENYEEIDKKEYESGDVYNSYWGLEPRFGLSYMLNHVTSLKGSYARTRQYLHLASNSTSGTPLDVWFMSSPNIEPQISDQFSVGYFKNLSGNTIETSVELFYKDMQNTIDFKDHPDLLLNEKMEGELRIGKSWAYGAELLVKVKKEKYNGWIGYTWSRSWREIPEINEGNKYLSPYSRNHDISVVLNRKVGKRGHLGMNWIYTSGSPMTAPTGRMFVGGDIIPIYSSRNEENMPDYHRMDISYTLKAKNKKNRKWQGEWNFSLYNVYGRKNAWSIYYEQDDDNLYEIKAQKTYLFQYVPSVTYNFKF
ncbi:TonB-dependent receptor [Saccharicrinis sp. GN24d3]|uniref:TonB-dependent receptor n=1 Tax=Saccharicrinis sp. GN24d3 TaxID=3458416 RepID=UPI004036CC20